MAGENNGPDTHFFDPAALLNHPACLAQNLPVKVLSKSQSARREELCGSPASLRVFVGQNQDCRVAPANFKIHLPSYLVLLLLPGFGTSVLKDTAGFLSPTDGCIWFLCQVIKQDYLLFDRELQNQVNVTHKQLLHHSKLKTDIKTALGPSVSQSGRPRYTFQYWSYILVCTLFWSSGNLYNQDCQMHSTYFLVL